MADPVADWHKEHEHFSTVLSLLRKELDVFQAGSQPGYGLALDIICWLRDFGDTFHHPREDEAFRRLAQRRPDRELPLARLRQEHVVIAQAGEELRLLLEKAVNGEVTPRSSRGSTNCAAASWLQTAEHRRPGSSAGADVPALGAEGAAVLADQPTIST